VLIAIEPDRIELSGELAIPEYQVMERLVEKGLRAQQRIGNLLTGQSYVSMRLHPEAKPKTIRRDDTHPVLPTIPNTVEEITATAKGILDRLDQLPLEETLDDIRQAAQKMTTVIGSTALESAIDNIDQSFAEFKKVTSDFNDGTIPRLNEMLEQIKGAVAIGEQALNRANTVLGEGAPVVNNLNRLLLELQDAARSVEALADYLERHPDAIVFGKGERQ
jgi:paraquat-inducible protein B